MSRYARVIAAALAGCGGAGAAQGACGSPPPQARNLADVKTVHLILRSARTIYLLNDDCFDLNRREFGGTLQMQVLNRFPSVTQKPGYIWVKSYRTFTNAQAVKFKVSRGEGWFVAAAASTDPVKAARSDDVPFKGSVEDWNAAHARSGSPEEFSSRLNMAWHAYTTQNRDWPSSDLPEFWKTDSTFDPTYGSITNFLIRFDVNTESSVSLVPFLVYVQPQVKQVTLSVQSNVEALNRTYQLNFR